MSRDTACKLCVVDVGEMIASSIRCMLLVAEHDHDDPVLDPIQIIMPRA